MPEADVETFEGYLDWLYTGQVTLKNLEPARVGPDSALVQLAQMYILGDYLVISHFCNAVIDQWKVRIPSATPNAEEISLVWDHTVPDCPLRAIIMAPWKSFMANPDFGSFPMWALNQLPKKFLFDMLAHVGERHAHILDTD